MDDPALVSRLERLGHLESDRQRLVDRDRPFAQTPLQVDARGQLHREEPDVPGLVQAVDGGDARVVERRQQLRLALEARQPVGVLGEQVRQDLDGHLAVERRVDGTPHHTHPPFANLLDEAVVADRLVGGEFHLGEAPSLLG